MSPLLAEAEGPPCGSIPQPLRSLFAEAAVKYPNNTAVASLYQQPVHGLHCLLAADTGTLIWTYGQLEKAADLLAISLYDQGIRKGMRIAAFLFNSAEWALLFWSSLKLGAIFVPLDARSVSRQEEAQHYLKVVDPAVLVVADNSAAAILQRQNALDVPESVLRMVASPDGPFHQGWIPLHSRVEEAVMSKTRLEEIYEPQNDDMQDIVMTIFTSGTSGLPKACPHTNMTLWMSYQGVSSVRIFGPDDRVVQHLPPSHSYACLDMLQSWVDGAAVVYASQSFDAKATLDAVESMHCTYISAIPGLYLALIMQPCFTSQRVQSLRFVGFGSTIISLETLVDAAEPAKLGTVKLSVGFGMSEVLPVLGTDPNSKLKAQGGCLGLDMLAPGARVRICEPGSCKILERGEVGELHIGGEGVIKRYMYGDNAVFYDDDWGHWIVSGDQAKMEVDGTFYILGRYKDIIIRAGENLSPALIETCLNKAGVMAQVIGVPDDVAGEVPIAVIQLLRQGPAPLKEMQALIQTSLGPQNTPAAYLTLRDLKIDAFPTTTSGKVRKDKLKETVIAYLSAQASPPQAETQIDNPVVGGNEQLLVQVFAELIGQPAASIPLDAPITTLADSINILRFQANVQKLTRRHITTEDVLSTASIRRLAKRLDRLPLSDTRLSTMTTSREGPPTTADMVHAQVSFLVIVVTKHHRNKWICKYVIGPSQHQGQQPNRGLNRHILVP